MCRGSRRHACEGYYQDVAITSTSECNLICALTLTSLWHDVHAAKALQRQDQIFAKSLGLWANRRRLPRDALDLEAGMESEVEAAMNLVDEAGEGDLF